MENIQNSGRFRVQAQHNMKLSMIWKKKVNMVDQGVYSTRLGISKQQKL